MYVLDFDTPCHVHFTGIGGISMSSLAEILLSKGFTVSGSDAKASAITERLTALGATIHFGHSADYVPKNTSLLVYTAAVNFSNPELAYAAEHHIALLTRAELLGQIMKNYETAIGVSGTHGKTTTTSMISQVLLAAQTDPTILVGGIFPTIGGNTRIGASGMFITESCEYTNSFLSFAPTLAVILNVKEDHLDFFKDIDDIRLSFRKFAELLPAHGTLVVNTEIDNYTYFTEGLPCNVVTYGTDATTSRYYAKNVTFDAQARGHYDLMDGNTCLGHIDLGVTGEHNVSNSLAAVAACAAAGIDFSTIARGIAAYTGTDRRFQHKGSFRGVTVLDDYAHHPDEIATTLKTAKKCDYKKIWCIFQPHTYTRTKNLLHEFGETLALADHVILTDIYAAREKNTVGISSLDLKREVEKYGVPCEYFATFSEVEEFAKKSCSQGDLLITMGAGDVVNIGEILISE
ncbi:MAG: UDP-N-acetylmuramate--L-alanine ligase [Lachnospiraceae bacterium]|nr:UDP-N-acetylmuramate--L-alanine ligase [Lachnospiraceae bacterium]